MVRGEMSSRERMMAALNCEEPDYTPCSFMLFKGLHSTCSDYASFIDQQIEMGLDTVVMIPPRPPMVVNDHYNLHGLPVSYDPAVTITEWIEQKEGGKWPLMIKEYQTPAGVLRAEVWQTEDWRWGNHVPFLDDYISSRSRKFLITRPEELEALSYLLVPPNDAEITQTKAKSEPILKQARQRNLLVSGGWGVGADLLGWILGLENMMFAAYDQPDFLHEILGLIAAWNHRRMEVLLAIGIDLYVKRAWYETCHFWTPKSYREFLFPILKADVELAHQAGARFGYIVTANTMPLLEMFTEAGVDVLIGVDPMEWDLPATKQIVQDRVCLWGGVNGHLTIEQGAAEKVRAEVREALRLLSPGGGFILSPVDNVRDYDELSRANVQALIEEWRQQTGRQ